MGHTLERKDNSKGYSPDNCEWATVHAQTRNKRSNRVFTINGETKCLQDWCEEYKITQGTVWYRLKRGVPIETALTAPPYSK